MARWPVVARVAVELGDGRREWAELREGQTAWEAAGAFLDGLGGVDGAPDRAALTELLDPDRRDWVVLVTVSFGFRDMFMNWHAWFKMLSLDMRVVFVAEDADALALCLSLQGLTCVKWTDSDAPSGPHRYGTSGFVDLVANRPMYVKRALDEFDNVIYSDIDTVWLADPRPFFTGNADVWGQLDSGDAFEYIVCSGFLAFRGTPGARRLVNEWSREFLEGEMDQPPLNRAIKLLQMQKDDSKSVRFVPLPRTRFPSGDMFFRTHAFLGLDVVFDVVIVHNNWINGKDNKIRRFKEVGLWVENVVAYLDLVVGSLGQTVVDNA